MFRKVLIANRGAIACRIVRTLRRMGIGSVAVYSDADRHSLHVEQADEAVAIGPPPAAQSYLSTAALLEAARSTGAEAIHPGYGFLSENADFAEECARNGIVFIGPTPRQMRAFGLKHTARRIAAENGVPLLPGTDLLQTAAEALSAAIGIGYPVMLKSTAGGGGIGMRLCNSAPDLEDSFAAVQRISQASFGSAGLYLEKFVAKARHIEVQIFGDGAGSVIALGERDCSAQRRHQKVIEETPAPGLAADVRARLLSAAVRLGEAVNYQSAGTVEFIYDDLAGAFYFLEVNTRLQVEHGITEEVTGIDLVEWMVRQAAGEAPATPAVLPPVSVPARIAPATPAVLPPVSVPAHIAPVAPAVLPPVFSMQAHIAPATPAVLPPVFSVPARIAPVTPAVLPPVSVPARIAPVTPAVLPPVFSMQARIYAEDPAKDFQPSAGLLTHVEWPSAVRVETWVEPGTEVTPYYDPMLAKIIVRGASRTEALDRLRTALAECRIAGIETNLEYLRQVCASAEFARGGIATSFLRTFEYRRNAIDVLAAGTQTTVQDFPGRIGYWHVGVPPSGPMDSLAFRIANELVGNAEGAPGLEITVTGPTLRFRCDGVIAITGADFAATLDGVPLPRWQAIAVKTGATLELTSAQGPGARAYLAVAGGFDVAPYLGSASTFILGKFGGHAGRPLRPGDVLKVSEVGRTPGWTSWSARDPLVAPLRPAQIPLYPNAWEIGVLYGPHGAPDFFTPAGIDTFFSTAWKVHHNSDRTGIRLIGPKPEWARKDGGEAGLHPSNIHDNAYAVGTVDFTGDMPVILGPDGPSLGGFVCPATIVAAELWKIGQLKPGDLVRFRPMTLEEAECSEAFSGAANPGCSRLSAGSLRPATRSVSAARLTRQSDAPGADAPGETRRVVMQPRLVSGPCERVFAESVLEDPILRSQPATETAPAVVCRADGDRNLLVEYGPNILDLNLRFRAHALETQLRAENLPGILDITPGVRSLQIHYDGKMLTRAGLLEALDHCERRIPAIDDMVAPSRVVHLPLSWDDPATQLAIRKYTQSVRPDAPWCPSNIEFIRRINGLESIDEVRRIVFSANYLVLGLGDVYLGAPVSTPVDPRHRLVTTKYNPARTWTPENAVGIGGAYLCVYGMEGPGGYQFVGRTVQMWNTYRTTPEFEPGKPWLLRFFDQIQFHPVSAEELLEIRDAFPHGRYRLRIEPCEFRLKDYHAFLNSIAPEAARFKLGQQSAFEAERERWAAAGADQFREAVETVALEAPPEDGMPEGCRPVCSPVTANVWNIAVEVGERVEAGQKLLVLEAMKMEIAVTAPFAGAVEKLNCAPGSLVSAGQNLVTLRKESI